MELVDIIGYEGLYKINRAGQVWSERKQKFMKYSLTKGYYIVNLNKEGKKKTLKVHRLICLQFLPNPNNLPQVDHIDRNTQNNSLDNLRWVSHRGNCCNKTIQPRSGEKNIRIVASAFEVRVRIGNQVHCKNFKTIEEAIAHRDLFEI
jgi:hypothetical protein